MNEPIAVEAHIEESGRLRPRAFRWRGRRYAIVALGRQWSEGEEQRYLVMTAGDRVYDLAYLPSEGAWRLRRSPEDFGGSQTPV